MALKLLIIIVLCLSSASLTLATCSVDGDCQFGGTCQSGACVCNSGFTGSNCELDINECEFPGACDMDSQCVNTVGSFFCAPCPAGMVADPVNAERCVCAGSTGTSLCTERIINVACRYLQLTLDQQQIPQPCLP